MDAFDCYHAQIGHAFLGMRDDGPHLADDPPLWREVWGRARGELLRDWIARHPGSRPPAWWRFDCGCDPAEGEPEVEFLHRTGELDAAELEAIRGKARSLVRYNDCGRRPDVESTHFIPPGSLHSFAASHGLLDARERAVLWPGKGPPRPAKNGEKPDDFGRFTLENM